MRWWSITATLLQAERSSAFSTCSGRFVSTITKSVLPSARNSASCGLINASLYSGSARSMSMSA